MRFNRTHLLLHMEDVRECNLLLNHLYMNIPCSNRMITTKSSNAGGEYYVKRDLRTFDIFEAIEYMQDVSTTKNRVEWLIVLETVKQDLLDFPNGVPETSDEWELKDIDLQSERRKRFNNDKRKRTITDRPRLHKERRRRDFVARFNEQFGED